jgi:hypothetical protein
MKSNLQIYAPFLRFTALNLQALNTHVLYYTRLNIGLSLISFHGACLLLFFTLIASQSYWFISLVKASY